MIKDNTITKCDYCGREKAGLGFFIGASRKPDWTMIEGTGKMTCPDCYAKAVAEGKEAVRRHVEGRQTVGVHGVR